MIDIESQIFDTISTALRTSFPGIFVSGAKVAAPKEYPCVSIEEADNYAYTRTQDCSNIENHASVMYELQVITNKTNGKKAQCKSIFALADHQFAVLGFTRIMKQPMSMNDAKTYQLIGRYKAVVSKNETIYRR